MKLYSLNKIEKTSSKGQIKAFGGGFTSFLYYSGVYS